MPGDQPASGSSAEPSRWRNRAGCLAYAVLWCGLGEAPGFTQRWSWPDQIALYVAVAGLIALASWYRIRRRGQTVAEAIAASRAERRRLAERRTRSRAAAAALPWLRDRQLSPGAVPGVLVTPGPDLPGYGHAGYDVVLDAPGDVKLRVARQVMRLTRLDPKICKDVIEGTPVTLLRVPDLAMADAARTILEFAGATVSIAAPTG